MSNARIWSLGSGFVLLLYCAVVNAQTETDPIIDEIRRLVMDSADPARLGAGYAAMINFAVSPDISSAVYSIDGNGDDDPTLNVTRIPFRHSFSSGERSWRPFLQANLAYQTLETDFNLFEEESIKADWKALGGSVSAGAEVRLSENLMLVPAIDIGLVRLENDADYRGVLAEALLKPALEGLLFDWEADALMLGVAVGFDYRRGFSSLDLNVHGSLTHNHIETYDSSSEFIDFDSRITTFDVQAETVHPTRMSIRDYPISLVTHVGATTFLGDNRDALGFDHFFETGLALEADLSKRDRRLQKLRLGVNLIFGSDVTGWGVILGYRF